MITREPSEVQDIRWPYRCWIHGDGDIQPTGSCPCCHQQMEPDYEEETYNCTNSKCSFILSDAVQAVVSSLLSETICVNDSVINACEIARAHTLEEDPAFRIQDRSAAGWLLKKMAEKQAIIDDINAEVDARVSEKRAEIDALNERREKMTADPARSMLYLETRYAGELEEWARAECKSTGKRSVALSYGKVEIKKINPQNIVDSEEDAIVFAEWLDEPESGHRVVNVKKSIYKGEFFDWIKANAACSDRVRVEEDGTISLIEDNPFLPDGEKPAVIAHIAPATEEFRIKAQMPIKGVQ